MNTQKKFRYISSLVTFLVSMLLMKYLRQLYFTGLIIIFIIVVFQTPSTKVDRTGEANDASIELLKFVGINTIAYLIGGYATLLLF